MLDKQMLEIRFVGLNMKPGLIRSKEIAELITAFEEVIASYVVAENPTIRKEDVVVGLAEIKDQSLSLCFQPNMEELTLPAAHVIAQAIRDNHFEYLPHTTRSRLKTIAKFIKGHECEAEFYAVNGSRALLATMPPAIEIPTDMVMSGQTEIYGTVTRVGGVDPRIQFVTFDGQTLYCEASRELVQEAGRRIYKDVVLGGEASWDVDTLKIERFVVETVAPFGDLPLPEAFMLLRETADGAFDKIEDVDEFVRQIRDEE